MSGMSTYAYFILCNVPRCCYVSQWTKIVNSIWKLQGKKCSDFKSVRKFNPIKDRFMDSVNSLSSWVLSCQKKKQERLRSELLSVDEITNLLFIFYILKLSFWLIYPLFFIISKEIVYLLIIVIFPVWKMLDLHASISKWEYWLRITVCWSPNFSMQICSWLLL